LPWNVEVAQKMFEELALTGNPSAQMGLAFLHATGIAVQAGSSQARALVYLTFAALGDDPLAQMALVSFCQF
jgi:SEL1 protein